jgi:AcrR family transcriptional regulator
VLAYGGSTTTNMETDLKRAISAESRTPELNVSTLPPQTFTVRGRILAVARQLFYENGFYHTSTREIAKRAGTSESGIFRNFGDKYELLMAVYNDCWKAVNDAISSQTPRQYRDPRHQILQILSVVWSLYEKEPIVMAFIVINTGNTDTLLVSKREQAIVSEENTRYVATLEALSKECVDQGLVDRALTARALSEGLMGLSEGILLGWYLADKAAPGRYPSKVTIQEACSLVGVLLYGAPRCQKPTGRR